MFMNPFVRWREDGNQDIQEQVDNHVYKSEMQEMLCGVGVSIIEDTQHNLKCTIYGRQKRPSVIEQNMKSEYVRQENRLNIAPNEVCQHALDCYSIEIQARD